MGLNHGQKALDWVMDNFEQEGYRDNVQIPWNELKRATDYSKWTMPLHTMRDYSISYTQTYFFILGFFSCRRQPASEAYLE